MDRALIVSGNDSATQAISKLIREVYPHCAQSVIETGNEARRLLGEKEYDAVIINCPLGDEYGNEFAAFTVEDTTSVCVMIVRSENADMVFDRMGDDGVMVVPKPISRQLFYQTLKIMNATRRRMLGIQKENVRLRKRLEEMRIINRAKFALMQYLGFSESQAHRYLEKQAMDMRTTKLEIAVSVIKTYES